jgi:hypothetical protein
MSENIRVVFIDVDGVLVPLGTHRGFARGCVAALNEVLACTGAVMVLSSSRRHSWSLRHANEVFAAQGIVGQIVGKTPGSEVKRAPEEPRQRWKQIVRSPFYQQAAGYVVIDDGDDMGPIADHQVQPPPSVGLQIADVELACRILTLPRTPSQAQRRSPSEYTA